MASDEGSGGGGNLLDRHEEADEILMVQGFGGYGGYFKECQNIYANILCFAVLCDVNDRVV